MSNEEEKKVDDALEALYRGYGAGVVRIERNVLREYFSQQEIIEHLISVYTQVEPYIATKEVLLLSYDYDFL